MTLQSVLIANRGEIACRLIDGLRALGLRTVAVYSDADQSARHVARADAARRIGPAPARESYLSIPALIAAAKDAGCDAVHPGYGFLSENAEFAEAVAAAGLVFLGPTGSVIRAMGDKANARRLAQSLGVPVTPGFESDADDATLIEEAAKLGFPLLVKAAMGGGGKGMRVCRSASDVPESLAAARREARSAFGSDRLILERFVHPARHVEVQILGDGRGRAVALLERECSLQRRQQKVVEECPSPVMIPSWREALTNAAVRLAAGVDYLGAGTVEFLLEADGRFHFLEMNTRLQVEHGVTELVTGEDLVTWQVRLAEGAELPASTSPWQPRGHAIQVRVYAEDPDHGFLPQSGRLETVRLPHAPGIRVDHGFRSGDEITPYYDPLILKMMAYGTDREAARRKLVRALSDTVLIGPPTNLPYLLDILESDAFIQGATFTHTLERDFRRPPPGPLPEAVRALLAVAARSGSSSGSDRAADPGAKAQSHLFEELVAFRVLPGDPS